MKVVNKATLRSKLKDILEEAASGNDVIVASEGKDVAIISLDKYSKLKEGEK